jgi:hypothetical protein
MLSMRLDTRSPCTLRGINCDDAETGNAQESNAQAALLTPIRDERDPTTPPCNPLPLEKSHIA